jgi:hypothetical protein
MYVYCARVPVPVYVCLCLCACACACVRVCVCLCVCLSLRMFWRARYVVDRPYVCVEGLPSTRLAAELEAAEHARLQQQARCLTPLPLIQPHQS